MQIVFERHAPASKITVLEEEAGLKIYQVQHWIYLFPVRNGNFGLIEILYLDVKVTDILAILG